MPDGLRERKKQKTRETITAAALELFDSQGFVPTTVAEIADAAEVSPRTYFTYFATKEAVVFGSLDEDFEALRQRLASRAEGESAIEALRGWIAETMTANAGDAREVRRRRLISETPALVAYEMAHIDPRFQAILGAAVAEDLGVEATEMAPQMVAAAASAALRTIGSFFATDDDHDPATLLAQSLAFLEAGIASLETP